MNEWRIDPSKLLNYLLSDTSAAGAAKNRFFRKFGFSPASWEVMHDALLEHPKRARLLETDLSSRYGRKDIYQCQIGTPDRRDPCIVTVWQYRDGDYWFVTARPFR
jgi:hypothetical protein